MFPYKSIVIARQLEELRTEASARRLAAVPAVDGKPDGSGSSRATLAAPIVTPRLDGYPYPVR